MFALGSKFLQSEKYTHHFDLGRKLTDGCASAYTSSKTGLSGEWMTEQEDSLESTATGYYQRPETIESIFYMWRMTHEQKYRDHAWNMALSIEKHTRQGAGYTALKNALDPKSGSIEDVQDSFFLAETLKYLYLIFCEDSVIPLEKYVFNTEAHPVSRRGYGKRAKSDLWMKIPASNEKWVGGRQRGKLRQ